MCVADNAGDAVLLHVSASSERQGSGNKIGIKKKGIKRQVLKLFMTMQPFSSISIKNINKVVQSS